MNCAVGTSVETRYPAGSGRSSLLLAVDDGVLPFLDLEDLRGFDDIFLCGFAGSGNQEAKWMNE
jgi:hypothetical protein